MQRRKGDMKSKKVPFRHQPSKKYLNRFGASTDQCQPSRNAKRNTSAKALGGHPTSTCFTTEIPSQHCEKEERQARRGSSSRILRAEAASDCSGLWRPAGAECRAMELSLGGRWCCMATNTFRGRSNGAPCAAESKPLGCDLSTGMWRFSKWSLLPTLICQLSANSAFPDIETLLLPFINSIEISIFFLFLAKYLCLQTHNEERSCFCLLHPSWQPPRQPRLQRSVSSLPSYPSYFP
jgi:hypothetical protein